MHRYLQAIGFSDCTKKDLQEILQDTIENYDEKTIVDENNKVFAEISKEYGYDCGIKVCGEYDENDEFQMEYYFPYFNGRGISTREEVMVEQRAEKECFSGACDDVRIGVTLIFYLANAGRYLKELYKNNWNLIKPSLALSALSIEGKILLPTYKDVRQIEKDQKLAIKRSQLLNEVRKGNEDAMESLTMEDMDTYSMISRRITKEDVFSIVDTYFMPYGMECDHYHILGEIVEVVETKNSRSGEAMYQLTVSCNDLPFDICINKKDLYGEPAPGRRFKGVIWMMGNLNF